MSLSSANNSDADPRSKFDVIVVGVGSMGAAACWQMARRGVRVLGLEQFAIPHGQGAHHGHSRMIRLSYYEHPGYVPLLRRSYEVWRELEREWGRQVLYVTGGLYLGPQNSKIVNGSATAAREHDLEHEMLDAREVRRRFPAFAIPDDFIGFYEAAAGLLVPEEAVAAQAELAMRLGAELHGHESVERWRETESGVEVTTARATYHAAHVVFTGGAWSNQLVSSLGIELNVTRQALAWFWPKRPDAFELGTFPSWFIETEPGFGHYGFPMLPGNPGLKVALHKPGTCADPDRVDRAIHPSDEAEARSVLTRHIPDGDGSLLALRTCLYTNSPDGHFIIGGVPGAPRATIACGFSGHGFKVSSAVGEVLADMAMGRQPTVPVDFLGLQRFS